MRSLGLWMQQCASCVDMIIKYLGLLNCISLIICNAMLCVMQRSIMEHCRNKLRRKPSHGHCNVFAVAP